MPWPTSGITSTFCRSASCCADDTNLYQVEVCTACFALNSKFTQARTLSGWNLTPDNPVRRPIAFPQTLCDTGAIVPVAVLAELALTLDARDRQAQANDA